MALIVGAGSGLSSRRIWAIQRAGGGQGVTPAEMLMTAWFGARIASWFFIPGKAASVALK